MVRQAFTAVQEAQEFAEQLDAINKRSLVGGSEASERIARILKAHELRCVELARAEAAEATKEDEADREMRSRQ